MDSIPDLDEICDLLDRSDDEEAMHLLDRLMTLYARESNIPAILDILEMLHLNYLEVYGIEWRLREVYKRLGRPFDEGDFDDEA